MFRETCKSVRESIYGVLCQSPVGEGQTNYSNGTAFMIAPGVCATASHVLHVEGDRSKPVHKKLEVIRTPEIGRPMLQASLIAENKDRDLALIRIHKPGNLTVLSLYPSKIETGTAIGALGFPLAGVINLNSRIAFNLVERFQGAFISAFQRFSFSDNVQFDFYETDSVVYGGSSGCPGFTMDGRIFGMVIGTASEGNEKSNSARLSISRWVPSMDIIEFAKLQGIETKQPA